MTSSDFVVDVSNLRVELDPNGSPIVESIAFRIRAGEVLSLVGESGSGKSTIGAALLGYARRGAKISAGKVVVAGKVIVPAESAEIAGLRGKVVGYIPQDPAVALNPAMRIGTLIEETLSAHHVGDNHEQRLARVREVLREVRLPADDDFLRRYPHQLSGGQQQRVCIAIAISCRPQLIVMDEPTTGLDVTTQAHVLRTLAELVQVHQMAALYITHDLAVVASIADRVMVLYSGRIAEYAHRDALFEHAGHPYTSALLGAAPDIRDQHELAVIPGRAPSLNERKEMGCAFAPRCTWAVADCHERTPGLDAIADDHLVACWRSVEVASRRDPRQVRTFAPSSEKDVILSVRNLAVSYGGNRVLSSVSFDLQRGECLALVGESGSGKTTLSRAIVGLAPNRSGDIVFRGESLPVHTDDFPADVQQKLQYVFQSPYRSLNPRRTVGASLGTAVNRFFKSDRAERERRIDEALERVSLTPRVKALYPDQLSGGERQRVSIARALVCKPEILLCDEVTSALDVSVQAAIVQLLEDLREAEGLTMLFVTHNLALVRSIADRVMVLDKGVVAESGPTAAVLDSPEHEYTRSLVRDTPTIRANASVSFTAVDAAGAQTAHGSNHENHENHERNIIHGTA